MTFLEVVAAVALATTVSAAVSAVVQAIMARFVLKRLDNALTAAAGLAAQLEQLVSPKVVPGPGEHGRVPEAPGDQAESPGPGSPL